MYSKNVLSLGRPTVKDEFHRFSAVKTSSFFIVFQLFSAIKIYFLLNRFSLYRSLRDNFVYQALNKAVNLW